MQVNPKVVAAITAAMQLYYQYQYQLEQEGAPSAETRPAREELPTAFSPWVLSGRQAAMEMRRAWQMRLAR